jgi:putative nucleotidyltransferase with HDIG domain
MNNYFESLKSEISSVSNERRMDFLLRKLHEHDETTYKHSVRVANILIEFAKHFNVTRKNIDILYNSALLHDIGKLCINHNVLKKQGGLSVEEWELLKKHTIYSNDIVQKLIDANVDYSMILHHHENIDGTGYIAGLKEKDLSFNIRLIRIVDSFEAMTAGRPYSSSLSAAAAIEELEKCHALYDQTLVYQFKTFLKKAN